METNENEFTLYLQRTVVDMLIEGLYDPEAANLEFLKSRRASVQISQADISVRMLKNQAIRLTGILEYELIRRGVPEQTIYIMSNQHMKLIESAKTAEAVREAFFSVYINLQGTSALSVQRPRMNLNEDMLSYIENATTRKYTLDEMAADLGYNRSYMCGKFKRLTGKTIREYDTECRIKEAKVLLRRTNMALKDIAQRLCFADQSHFQRVFHQKTGVTPQKFRNSGNQ